MGRMETCAVDGSEMEVYVDVPAGAGPHPAMVVTFHRGGIDAFTRKFVDDLAAAGYAAAAPNFYHRRPADEDTVEAMSHVIDVDIVSDINGAVALLQGNEAVDSDAIGIVGHCFGGRNSFLGAASNPVFRACAVFYGGNTMVARGEGRPTPFELMKNIACPVIGFFGNDDKNPSPDDVAKIDAELTSHGIAHTFHAYDGTGHAFQNFLNEAGYRPEATKDSQPKLLAFLAEHLPTA